jgi:DNA-binding MarR family transcriptional regulator
MPHELREIGHAIKRVQHRHHRAADARLLPLGITLVQWDALRQIASAPGATSHELAQATFQTDQGFGSLSNRLLARGLIERRSPSGRAIHHHLSPSGSELVTRGGVILEEMLRESFGGLSQPELETLRRLLGRILDTPLSSKPPISPKRATPRRAKRPSR